MIKEKDYKVDSTRGKSLINPLNYKGDVLVQVWMDSRVLATLCRWLDNSEFHSRFMSQVVRRPLEVLAESMVANGEVEIVDDTAEARSMLERRFGVDLNRGGRGTKNLQHNVTLSINRAELGDRLTREKRYNDVNKPNREYGPVAEASIDKYHELFPDDSVVPEKRVVSEIPTFKLGKGDMPSETFNERERIRAERDRLQQEEMDKFLASQRKE